MQGFNPVLLRQSLTTFHKSGLLRPDTAWHAYLTLYKLAPLQSQYQLRVGLVKCEQVDLAVQYYTQQTTSRGTVVLIHGYMDHVGLYSRLMGCLLEQGWDVLCYDLPGHGLSSGSGYSIDHFSTYAAQLDIILQSTHLKGPCVALGQSTGGAIVLAHQQLVSQRLSVDPFSQRILLAPLIRPAQYPFIRLKYSLLRFFLRRVRRFHGINSHDDAFVHFIRSQDPLQKQWVAVNWIGAMLEWVELIEAGQPQHIDMTVIQGTADETVDWQHNLSVLGRLFPLLRVELIEAGRHHLANEGLAWRQQVFDKISEVLAGCRAEH
ncbi:alpha/beta hydrolase [Neptunomonas qingdaonensis]|uniref:Lysophospholipase n=1 Tax=Neptunomonas qingdaonensis TaxID=1045558 RepID=A0A1I2M3L4_9GAMM|nr:alpha/beta hydrolase [Neptunomonas qingdaonensis]SFF86053.1 lysophospholipase [Neptunomonas qingdaonensis]